MTSTEPRFQVLCIVGARPNFMKIAPIIRAIDGRDDKLSARLLHTGQHYDEAMKASFFEHLGIPEPDVDLEVGSASHAVQTAEIMRRFEVELDRQPPDAILVVGDVNSTIACALVAAKKGIPIVHVEAGLRSFDRRMPEEINRVLTDQLADVLFTTERQARGNLEREGVASERIFFVGNVMIDTLVANTQKATPPPAVLAGVADRERFLGQPGGYGLVTLHRPANVDDPSVLRRLLEILAEISSRLPLIFPVHPRTRARIAAVGLEGLLEAGRVLQLPPLGYLEMLGLMRSARLVLTDSGGIQEETTALGVPCVTLRENTERPITVDQGTNTVVGSDPGAIRSCVEEILTTGGKAGRIPELWDGRAAERIADILVEWGSKNAHRADAMP